MAKVAAKPPGVFGVVLTDLVIGAIWLFAALQGLERSPIEAVVNFVLMAGIVTVAILTIIRKPFLMLISMAAHILLTLLLAMTGIFSLFIRPASPAMARTGLEVSEYAGVLIVVIIPAICAAHCWKIYQYDRRQAAAAARERGEPAPAAPEDDFDAARGWDEGRKK